MVNGLYSSLRFCRWICFALAASLLFSACSDKIGQDKKATPSATVVRPKAPILQAVVVESFPFDSTLYTQGLCIEGGKLYVSGGLHYNSSLNVFDMQTKKRLLKLPIEGRYFAEGIAIAADKLYMLTWQDGKCIVYTADKLSPVGEFGYFGEGWGITAVGEQLATSNGSDVITYRSSKDFSEMSKITVSDGDDAVASLNELEYIEGEIWANVYQTNKIACIDPVSGVVKRWIDCSSLVADQLSNPIAEVLNGIAVDRVSGDIFLTGKLWNRIYKITTRQ